MWPIASIIAIVSKAQCGDLRISLTFEVCMQLFAAESEYLQADHSQCGSVLKVR